MGSSRAIHTQEVILRAALRCFAEKGYAAASVQEIVSRARVSKPALYYYFGDKATLFEALVEKAQAERYRLMSEAAERGQTVAEKLREIAVAVFAFALKNQALVRLQFASAFAAPGHSPGHAKCLSAGRRNFELIRGLIVAGQASAELDASYSPEELAMGIYGQLNMYMMVRLLSPEYPLDGQAAERIVRLFMEGATAKQPGADDGTPRKSGANGRGPVRLRS
jgi:AcrR family transcriptional regulator